jgi:hypothetical protein
LTELFRGVIRLHRAARIMGVSPEELGGAAERERIDRRLGFHVDDLIRLATKLSVTTRDPERKARLRAAVSTFIQLRNEAESPMHRERR